MATMALGAGGLAIPHELEAEGSRPKTGEQDAPRPNILYAMTDDQSWTFTSREGRQPVRTPAFDRVAREGINFTNCYCAAPSCTPSRGAILSGQEFWRLGSGATLQGTLPSGIPIYTDLLESVGYAVGFTGKGWGPGSETGGGRVRNPAGREYNEIRVDDNPRNISNTDYAANFEAFLAARAPGQPFCFWAGFNEPHWDFPRGIGERSGMKPEEVEVPPFLPDAPEVRADLMDYMYEIQWADRHLERMLEALERIGELDNTLVVATSDNGMPFPRAKAGLYDYGTRMPLAIRWGGAGPRGRVVDDMVSLTDMAPTFLEAAGMPVPAVVTGRSLLSVLKSNQQGRVDPERARVFFGRERHTNCQPDDGCYPSRGLRTHEYLYIRNYEPDRWPHGAPDFENEYGMLYGDSDGIPTTHYMTGHKDDPEVRPLYEAAFAKRPGEELFDVRRDPYQLHNLADDPAHGETLRSMREELGEYLRSTKDPRAFGLEPWPSYPDYHLNPEGRVPYPWPGRQ